MRGAFARLATSIIIMTTSAFQLKSESIVNSAYLITHYIENRGNSEHKYKDGPVTLFIHGLDSSSRTWRGVQQALHTPSVALDCRGCGRSELGDPGEFAPDALVADVKSLVAAHPLLRDTPFVLCGHSMGGRVAMSYAAQYPEDVAALVIEDMDIRRRSVLSHPMQNFDWERAIAFSRRQDTLDSVKKELKSIGYPEHMYTKWIDEGRIYKDSRDGKPGSGVFLDEGNSSGEFWSDVNPAFRALCYRTFLDSDAGTEAWSAIARQLQQQGKGGGMAVSLMVAGLGTVCDADSIEDMRRVMSGAREGAALSADGKNWEGSPLTIKTYTQGTHSIHNSAQEEFMADLNQIINNANALIKSKKEDVSKL